MLSTRFALVALLSVAAANCGHAQESTEPYGVEVWVNVLFGIDGMPVQYTLADEEQYPDKFAENIKARVARAKIQAPLAADKPATFRTGLRFDFLVTPNAEGGGEVRISGLTLAPLPIKRYYASYPKDLARAKGWVGEVEGFCKVGLDGQCASIEVKALPGMPESVRRYAKISLEGWLFSPQEINGQPVEGEFVLRLRLNTFETAPENFRQNKFLRILNSR